MEMTITNRRGKSSSYYKFKKPKGETKRSSKPSKASTKETMTTSVLRNLCEFQENLRENEGSSSRDRGRKRPTLKDLQEKKYPFPDSDL